MRARGVCVCALSLCLILLQNANQSGDFIADGIGRINEITK